MARISADERRRQLTEAAFRVMAREGVAAATTRAIAAEADAPLASFHYCFRSKEELLRELTPALVDRMLEGAMADIKPGRDFREMLRAGLASVWSVIESTPAEQQVLYELTQYALRNPGLEELASRQYERYYEVARDQLQAIADVGDVEWAVPLPVAARMLISFFDGLALGWIVDRNSAEARAALDGFTEGLALMARPRSEVSRRRSSREAAGVPAPARAAEG